MCLPAWITTAGLGPSNTGHTRRSGCPGTGAGGCHLQPDAVREKWSGSNAPSKSIARVKNHHYDWLEAIKSGRQAGSNFEYGGRLTQIALLGAIAIRFPDKTLNWDGQAARFT